MNLKYRTAFRPETAESKKWLCDALNSKVMTSTLLTMSGNRGRAKTHESWKMTQTSIWPQRPKVSTSERHSVQWGGCRIILKML